MKKKLIRYREFKSKKDLGFICNRILSTGYFSKKNTDEIEEMTGVVGIVDDIKKKINDLNRFFKSKPIDFIDDVLLEFFEVGKEESSLNIVKSICPVFEKHEVFYVTKIDAKYHNLNIDEDEMRYLSCTQLQSFMYVNWYINYLNLYKKKINSKEYSDYLEEIHNYLYEVYIPYKRHHDANKIFLEMDITMDEVFIDSVKKTFERFITERYGSVDELKKSLSEYIRSNYSTIKDVKEAVDISYQLILPYCAFYLYKLDNYDSYYMLLAFLQKNYPEMSTLIDDKGYAMISRHFVSERFGYSISSYLEETLQNYIDDKGFKEDSNDLLAKIRIGIDKETLNRVIEEKIPLFDDQKS